MKNYQSDILSLMIDENDINTQTNKTLNISRKSDFNPDNLTIEEKVENSLHYISGDLFNSDKAKQTMIFQVPASHESDIISIANNDNIFSHKNNIDLLDAYLLVDNYIDNRLLSKGSQLKKVDDMNNFDLSDLNKGLFLVDTLDKFNQINNIKSIFDNNTNLLELIVAIIYDTYDLSTIEGETQNENCVVYTINDRKCVYRNYNEIYLALL